MAWKRRRKQIKTKKIINFRFTVKKVKHFKNHSSFCSSYLERILNLKTLTLLTTTFKNIKKT